MNRRYFMPNNVDIKLGHRSTLLIHYGVTALPFIRVTG